MRQQNQLLLSRARVRPRYAVLPVEGYPPSCLPAWDGVEAFVLAAPALGAGFAEYLLNLQPGQRGEHIADHRTETFLYLLSGQADVSMCDVHNNCDRPIETLAAGGFALVPPAWDFQFQATESTQLLMLRKAYEPLPGVEPYAPLTGSQSERPGSVYMGIEGSRLQTLLPAAPAFDMAMNIFTFEPGFSLPVVETHVMEHGLYFLQGKGLYYLDGEWMEVEKDDFIWMGPYCPQSFYATGPVASQYLYYKNVNRDVQL